ncbi:hypothetical protein Celaphus_00008348 [Cervus elaphus hippelaphus]|uniref:Uncharacterized protein n=1 Tax=Cervus elaphus hippelaphus TaxID=46360 RepID=A0A212CPD3_CEREH|nr:hypothetical protein Celaphus_00008348 [Cervus elaphus hippelaphus]
MKKGMSLEQGESKVNFVNHGPDDVRGPASLSSLRDSCFLAQLATLLQGMKGSAVTLPYNAYISYVENTLF